MCVLALALSCRCFAQDTPGPQPSTPCAKLEHRSSIPEGQRRLPEHDAPKHLAKVQPAALLGLVETSDGLPLSDVKIKLTPQGPGKSISTKTGNEGIIQVLDIPPGKYNIAFEITAAEPNAVPPCPITESFGSDEVVVVEVTFDQKLVAANEMSGAKDRKLPENGISGQANSSIYQELFRRPAEQMRAELREPEIIFYRAPDRWDTDPNQRKWRRYKHRPGEFPYVRSHWWDPFDQNRIKGDKPILGQSTFLNLSGTSTTAVDVRRLFVPSGVSAANQGNTQFFGRGGQALIEETVRLTADLFHGDTSFKPVDWRVRITPAFNVNQLWARERGIVNIDVREGTSRTDGHVGLQEAFVEKKIHDLSPNYDFISIRAGIQQFTSDFRGLLFSQEQPGVRIFGNLHSNRLQYNAAYFFFLEKDTNSGLNTVNSRHQQVSIANFYWQDFLFKGYTTQFSYHYNKDDATRHFDENGFLVRPAPIGNVVPHSIHSHYIGWTSNGHIGKVNVSHAIYQALGHDSGNMFNRPGVTPKRAYINAQMAALELSVDRDWVRLHTSGFFASGDAKPSDGTARGFDAISEAQSFAGGIFSFFNREGIRLTGTGVGLVAPDSFLPNLRSNKEEGQSNFINPGIFLVNAGADFNLTPTLRAVTNVNYMRFNHTEPLETLLFQSHIDQSIGTDYGVGVVYRPKLSENIVITSGVAALTPGTGLRQIYTSKTLVSGFTTVRFQF